MFANKITKAPAGSLVFKDEGLIASGAGAWHASRSQPVRGIVPANDFPTRAAELSEKAAPAELQASFEKRRATLRTMLSRHFEHRKRRRGAALDVDYAELATALIDRVMRGSYGLGCNESPSVTAGTAYPRPV
jgi:hypothetical protein